MQLIPYQPEHFVLLDLQDSQQYILETLVSTKEYAHMLSGTYMPMTLIVENEVMAIYSINLLSPECGEIVSLLSKKIKGDNSKRKYYYSGFKSARQYMDNVLLYRVEASIQSGNEEQKRLVEFLGLTYECTKEGAGINRTNIDIYKRIRT